MPAKPTVWCSGASPAQVDKVLSAMSLAMRGVFAMYDLAGIDVGYLVRQARRSEDRPTIRATSAWPTSSTAWAAMAKKSERRLLPLRHRRAGSVTY